MPVRKQFSIFPVFLTVFIDMLGVGIAIPIFATVLLRSDANLFPIGTPENIRNITLGLLIASYPIVQFFGSPILGAISDRKGRKKVLTITITVTMIGYILFGIGLVLRNLPLLFASRIIDGFTGGSISVCMSSIADISDRDEKVRNFGLVGMAFGMGFILGPFIGGILSDPTIHPWFTYSMPFWFAAAVCGFNAILLQWKFKETLHTRIDTPISALTGIHNIVRAFQLPSLRTMFAVVFLLTLGFNFFTQFFQVYLIDKFAFTQSQIGYLFAFVGVWIAITQGGITRMLSHRFTPQQTLAGTIFLLAFTLPLLLLPENAIYLLVILPFVAIFEGLIIPNSNSIISNLADEKSQGEIMGINQSIQSLGMAIPPIIAGFIVSVHQNLPILSGAAFTLVAWVVFVRYYKEKPHEKQFTEL